MSVDKKYKPHVLVLPEDSANRQIAIGFILNSNVNEPVIQILPIANGWKKVVSNFTENHVSTMRRFPKRMIVLLIDFDQNEDRLTYVKQHIPSDLEDRVFILGVFSEPERLKSDIKRNFEQIGEALATDCSDNTDELWGHNLLRCNKTELDRMILAVKPHVFTENKKML